MECEAYMGVMCLVLKLTVHVLSAPRLHEHVEAGGT